MNSTAAPTKCPAIPNSFTRRYFFADEVTKVVVNTTATAVNTAVELSCLPGLELNQDKNVTICLPSGRWDFTKSPVCQGPTTITVVTVPTDLSESDKLIIGVTSGLVFLVLILLFVLAYFIRRKLRYRTERRLWKLENDSKFTKNSIKQFRMLNSYVSGKNYLTAFPDKDKSLIENSHHESKDKSFVNHKAKEAKEARPDYESDDQSQITFIYHPDKTENQHSNISFPILDRQAYQPKSRDHSDDENRKRDKRSNPSAGPSKKDCSPYSIHNLEFPGSSRREYIPHTTKPKLDNSKALDIPFYSRSSNMLEPLEMFPYSVEGHAYMPTSGVHGLQHCYMTLLYEPRPSNDMYHSGALYNYRLWRPIWDPPFRQLEYTPAINYY